MNITIQTKALKAAMYCVGTDDARLALNYVHIRFPTDHTTASAAYCIVEATNGHSAFVCRAASFAGSMGEYRGQELLLEQASLRKALSKYRKPLVTVATSAIGEMNRAYVGGVGNISGVANVATVETLKTQYPNIGSVVPDTYDGISGFFDPEVVIQAKNAIAVWNEERVKGFSEFKVALNEPNRKTHALSMMRGDDPDGFAIFMPRHHGDKGAATNLIDPNRFFD